MPKASGELEVKSIPEQLKSQMPQINDGIFYIFVGPNEFQRINGMDFLPPRSYSQKRKTIDAFNTEDEFWELLRFKWENLLTLEKRWKELKLDKYQLDFYLWGTEMKKPQLLKFHFEKVCPQCDFESLPPIP